MSTQVNKNHEIMSINRGTSIKNLETHIGQLSRQITVLPSLNGGFTCNIIYNPKNESCKSVETGFGVTIEKGEDEIIKEDEDEIVKEDVIEKEGVIEKEESNNHGDQEQKRVTIDKLIDKNSL